LFNTIGERISYCRGMLGLTRDKFIEKFKIITLSTLARWELNSINIPEQKLKLLSDFFNKNGILVKLEWIRYGEGVPPINMLIKNIEHLNFDEMVYTTLSSISLKIKDFKFYQINSNFFEPIINYGDYIGGVEIFTNFAELHNKLCFFKTDLGILIGYFDYYNICLVNTKNVKKKINLISGGEITWIMRRS
jgi:transcriptional regulator with XRE-family HTH domain